ncbi:MAG: DUF1846 family protein [Bacilli bacterium]|nr:DUF1846 family protein [Bacilli bacterium]
MVLTPFDNDKYLYKQKEAIINRKNQFSKLYLEVGGKLFDDYHAARVLPGFLPDNKLKVLSSLKEESEIIIVINSDDIKSRRIRGDLNITYDVEVERLIVHFQKLGISINSVVFSFYEPNKEVDKFIKKLKKNKITTYKHYKINGYPQNTALIVSENGLGKNEYIKTTKDIVIVTAPGPGSGKMATCLSQLYHDHKHGINAGYAKYETFPVYNLDINHPVNIAYEAATLDLLDVNMIDPFHLQAYGINAVNYNRDIATFPLLRTLINLISGNCLYRSPTDMGINMVGHAFNDDEKIKDASKQEIIRRYYETKKNILLGNLDESTLEKCEMLMNNIEVSPSDRKCVDRALLKEKECGTPSIALELHNGQIITGRRSELLTSSAAVILNALKYLAHINDDIPLLSRNVIEPIVNLKINSLHNENPKIHLEEILIALAIQAATNPMAELALQQIEKLKGTEAHSSCILSLIDLRTFKKMGINITEEPKSYLYNK